MGYYADVDGTLLVTDPWLSTVVEIDKKLNGAPLTRDPHTTWAGLLAEHMGDVTAEEHLVDEKDPEGPTQTLLHLNHNQKFGAWTDNIIEAIAPCVTGILNYRGEDGCVWRYVFADGKVETQEGRVYYGKPIVVDPATVELHVGKKLSAAQIEALKIRMDGTVAEFVKAVRGTPEPEEVPF